jgi:hypothetical protein
VTCDSDIIQHERGHRLHDSAGPEQWRHACHAQLLPFEPDRRARHLAPHQQLAETQVVDSVNSNAVQCNAFWDSGTLNFLSRAGLPQHRRGSPASSSTSGGTASTRTTAATDSPSKPTRTSFALLSTCLLLRSRLLRENGNCSYSNSCLNCSGSGSGLASAYRRCPSTPRGSGYLLPERLRTLRKRVHCRVHRRRDDLRPRTHPAAGLDLPTSWQAVDKLWYKSRRGGGPRGSALRVRRLRRGHWFKLRAIDDDDLQPTARRTRPPSSRHSAGTKSPAAGQPVNRTPRAPDDRRPLAVRDDRPRLGELWSPVPNATAYKVLRNAPPARRARRSWRGPDQLRTRNGEQVHRVLHDSGRRSEQRLRGVLSRLRRRHPRQFAGRSS